MTLAAGAALAVEPVRFLGVSAHRLGGHLRRHHPILEPGKYTLLKVTTCDRAGVRAGAIGNTGRTGITVLAAQRAGATANAAMDQPGKQRLRPAQAIQSVRLRLPYSSMNLSGRRLYSSDGPSSCELSISGEPRVSRTSARYRCNSA